MYMYAYGANFTSQGHFITDIICTCINIKYCLSDFFIYERSYLEFYLEGIQIIIL